MTTRVLVAVVAQTTDARCPRQVLCVGSHGSGHESLDEERGGSRGLIHTILIIPAPQMIIPPVLMQQTATNKGSAFATVGYRGSDVPWWHVRTSRAPQKRLAKERRDACNVWGVS